MAEGRYTTIVSMLVFHVKPLLSGVIPAHYAIAGL